MKANPHDALAIHIYEFNVAAIGLHRWSNEVEDLLDLLAQRSSRFMRSGLDSGLGHDGLAKVRHEQPPS
jgi:hypothetical protein